MATASEIAVKLNLNPHPEGGFYSETFRDTSILLSKCQLPPELLELSDEDGKFKLTDLIGENEQLQYTVKPNVWLGAFPTKDFNISLDGTMLKAAPRDAETHYSLVGCSCALAFHL